MEEEKKDTRVEILTREGEESYFTEDELLGWVETLPPEIAFVGKVEEKENTPED